MVKELRCLNTFTVKETDGQKPKKGKSSGRSDCEYRKQKTISGEKVYVCTGDGYCPFREDVSKLIKRESTPERRKRGR